MLSDDIWELNLTASVGSDDKTKVRLSFQSVGCWDLIAVLQKKFMSDRMMIKVFHFGHFFKY